LKIDLTGYLRAFLVSAVAVLVCCAEVAKSDFRDDIPKNLIGVGVDERLDGEIPLDVEFVDDRGATVTFRKLLSDKKPLLLTLNYSNCPGLCITQINGMIQGVNDVSGIRLGRDFKMVSLSIDPSESVKRAAATKKKYADDLENHHSADGWFFLTGTEANIVKIADSVGFRYTYDAKNKQFNHSAAAIFISPQGRITRYLYEVGFIRGETLRMAFIEAGEGKIGSSFDRFVLWCSHYDANENRYSASARILLSVTAGGFVAVGLVGLVPFWLSRQRQTARGIQSGKDHEG
jgi:protein SCO1/2